MAKHHPDLIMCRKQPGIAIGRLCEKCDGKCVICDSYVRSEHPPRHKIPIRLPGRRRLHASRLLPMAQYCTA